MRTRWMMMAGLIGFCGMAQAAYYTIGSYTTLNHPDAGAPNPYGYSFGTFAGGISGGNVVGYYYDTNYIERPYVYSGGTYTTLYVPGAKETRNYYNRANGIDGNNVVGYYDTEDNKRSAFLYDGVSYTSFMLGTNITEAYGISGDNIVGAYTYTWESWNFWRGFMYGGTINSNLPLFGIGIDGSNIVGGVSFDNTVGAMYDGENYTFFSMPGAQSTMAYDISGNNVVGSYIDSGSNKGFIYDGTNYSSLVIDGSMHTQITGIDGDKVSGYFSDEQGTHSFIGTLAPAAIPEPASIMMIGLGGLLIAGYRRFFGFR